MFVCLFTCADLHETDTGYYPVMSLDNGPKGMVCPSAENDRESIARAMCQEKGLGELVKHDLGPIPRQYLPGGTLVFSAKIGGCTGNKARVEDCVLEKVEEGARPCRAAHLFHFKCSKSLRANRKQPTVAPSTSSVLQAPHQTPVQATTNDLARYCKVTIFRTVLIFVLLHF